MVKSFTFKNITFNKNEIIIKKKKGDIIIPADYIERMEYNPFSIWNFFRNLLTLIFLDYIRGFIGMGYLKIILNAPIESDDFTYKYNVWIRYKNLKKFPKEVLDKIDIE